jgi:hypothetical protein
MQPLASEIDLSYTKVTGDLISYGMSVKNLLEHYQNTGFLSGKKKERIAPYESLIIENCESVLSLDAYKLLWVPVCKSTQTNLMASISIWRTTNECWFAQHMSSEGDPTGLVSVILNSLTKGIITFPQSKACQHWYSPDNKFADRIYKTMVDSVGTEYSSNKAYEYLEVDPEKFQPVSTDISVQRCQREMVEDLKMIAIETRGELYDIAEELNGHDLELNHLDQYYQSIGLRRKRYIWIAYDKDQTPLGAAICYRGPLGLNLSFLENRCDLLIRKQYFSQLEHICSALINKANDTYFSNVFDDGINQKLKYPLSYIQVVTDYQVSIFLQEKGAKHIRSYNQCIWLFEGYYNYYKYLEKIFNSVIVFMKENEVKSMNEKELYNTRPTKTFIKMIKNRYTHVNTDELIKYMGKEVHQIEDPGQWLTQDEINRFYEKVVEVTGNENIAREAGRYLIESEILESFKRYLLALKSPEIAYQKVVKEADEIDRSTDYKSNIIGNNKVEIIAVPKEGVKQKLFQCQNRYGNIEQVPIMFGCKLTKEVEHDECIFKGGKRCRYVVQWSESKPFKLKKLRLITLGLFLLTLLGIIFLVKPISPLSIAGTFTVFLLFFLFIEQQEKAYYINEVTSFSDLDTSYHTLMKASDFSELFKSICETIGEHQNIDNILSELIKPLEKYLDFDFGVILLSDEQKTKLKFIKGYGLTKETENILGNTSYLLNNINMVDQYFIKAFHKKTPKLLNILDEPSKLSEDETVVNALKSSGLIVCPILHNGESLGIIAVFHKEKKRELIQRDINILMGVASTIGGFISKAKE